MRNHQLSVPDDLWVRYGRSGKAMRDALWRALVVREPPRAPVAGNPPPRPPRPENGGEEPWGTLFLTSGLTACPLCSSPLVPDSLAVMTSWTSPTPRGDRRGPIARGQNLAVHLVCAERYHVEVRWTPDRVLGDLRRRIRKIPRRRLRTAAR